MTTSFTIFSILLIGSAALAQKPVCVAQLYENIGSHGSDIVSNVYCQDGKNLRAGRTVTGVILPLPIQGKKVAAKKELTSMNELGYRLNSSIETGVGSRVYRFLPFNIYIDSTESSSNFCLVLHGQAREAGLQDKVKVTDIRIACDDGSPLETADAVTAKEVSEFLRARGYEKIFAFDRVVKSSNWGTQTGPRIEVFQK